jgi:hypothetical protein
LGVSGDNRDYRAIVIVVERLLRGVLALETLELHLAIDQLVVLRPQREFSAFDPIRRRRYLGSGTRRRAAQRNHE